MTQLPSPQFVQTVAASVAFWQERTKDLDGDAIVQLDQDRENLYRVVQFGLGLAETWRATAVVALQCFSFVEQHGYWPEWTPFLEKALQLCGEEDGRLRFEILAKLGQFYLLNRQLSLAITTHQEAQALATALADDRMIAEAHFNLGADYLECRDYAAAEKHGQQALAGFCKIPQTENLQAITLKYLGSTARAKGNLELAQDRLEQAVTVARSLKQTFLLARALNDLAITFHSAKKYGEAYRCLQEAELALVPTKNELDKARVQTNLGMVYYALERWDKAEQAFKQADLLHQKMPWDRYQLAVGANNLGNVMLKQGDLVTAEAYLRRSIDLWQQLDDGLMLGNTLGTLGEVLVLGNQIQKAIPIFEEAVTRLNKQPHNAWAKNLGQKYSAKLEEARQNLPDSPPSTN